MVADGVLLRSGMQVEQPAWFPAHRKGCSRLAGSGSQCRTLQQVKEDERLHPMQMPGWPPPPGLCAAVAPKTGVANCTELLLEGLCKVQHSSRLANVHCGTTSRQFCSE